MFDPTKPYNDLPLLPPKFEFDQVSILKKLNAANIALSTLSGAASSIPNSGLLIEPLTVREAVASSGIENINTTVSEVFQAELFAEQLITKAQKETLHYKDALREGYMLINGQKFLNTNSYEKLQSILEPTKTDIRKLPEPIKNEATGEIIYTPPVGEELLRNLLKNFDEYLNRDNSTDPLIKMAVLHYQFEAIHPFMDGNGRTGRILMLLYLMLKERLELPILFISGYIDQNRSEYYRLLKEVTTSGNWHDWVMFILDAVELQAHDTLKTVQQIRLLRYKYKELISRELPKIYTADLVDFLFANPFYTRKRLVAQQSIHLNTAGKYLKLLLDKGVIKAVKIKKEVVYFNEEFLDLLK